MYITVQYTWSRAAAGVGLAACSGSRRETWSKTSTTLFVCDSRWLRYFHTELQCGLFNALASLIYDETLNITIDDLNVLIGRTTCVAFLESGVWWCRVTSWRVWCVYMCVRACVYMCVHVCGRRVPTDEDDVYVSEHISCNRQNHPYANYVRTGMTVRKMLTVEILGVISALCWVTEIWNNNNNNKDIKIILVEGQIRRRRKSLKRSSEIETWTL